MSNPTISKGFTWTGGATVMPTRLNQTADGATIQCTKTDVLIGRSSSGAGQAEEVDCTPAGRTLIAKSSAATQKDLLEKQGSTITPVAALDIDCSTGVYFTKTVNGASAFTFSNPPASGAYAFALEVTHTSGTITWPASVKWPNDTAPTLTTGKTHLCSFVTSNGGTRWRGAVLANYAN